ncbi:PD-(D/E)XK nuclease [Cedratvirus Zaza IHUMI]|uniref:PD-(D/E)XK nuclease n=1 Tax=Cedratvirus Zaza IHUMI TaxID=2126979 RepID=A0A2R8FFN5_9VIRU|nr:PD-(D/E)XK nuclease [Cedratvirus Zaza IHUMI]
MLNVHPRDAFISFEEREHLYTVGSKRLTSVTTLISSHFSKFNASKVIDKMQNSSTWPKSKYYGMEKQEIIDLWEKNGEDARNLGTLMHEQIEKFFLSEGKDLPEEKSPEFNQFLDFWNVFSTHNPGFKPYRMEWRVYSEEIAGSIDCTLVSPGGDIVIIDWKRSKGIEKYSPFGKGLGKLSHLSDCNFVHYSLQLNSYRHILENFYDKRVSAMYLAVFHPLQEKYKFIEVPYMKEVEGLIK